ncbi:MAG: hypothetical protein ACD_7C00020G0002 [uncultured bacterium]|nr:MAG: hypothetical protein ACD_7C00020G0002 [uncultured bacterium]KKP67806.1 MAG: Phage integrase [Candidatus Moranbacteria bacterium GW2011_GWE1_35_17]KKP83882.1 MAG: Phage integrase [Candidatus Moranbacteria bacterium GW2011_GWF1_35_5]KKP83944.1 MAG: Phage integrase [Candidatus Moranbacteria bacterium GW2011_GWF2_35_54]
MFLFSSEKYKLSKCFERYFDNVSANLKLAWSSINKYIEVAPRVIKILEDIDIRKIDADSITKLKKELNLKGLSPPRKNHYLVVLRNLLSFVKNEEGIDVYDSVKIKKFIEPRKKIEFLKKEEIQRLLDSIDDRRSITRLRLKTVILCLFSCGCRVSELLSLNHRDIDFQTGVFETRTKGGKIQKKILNSVALEYLGKYLEKRVDNHECLFCTHNSSSPKRWQINDLQRALRNQGRKVGLKVTPHTLRRSASSYMFHQGVSLSTVQQFLGHSSPQVTERYYLGDSSFAEVKRAHSEVMNIDFK